MSRLSIIAPFFIQSSPETKLLQSGNFEQNFFPEWIEIGRGRNAGFPAPPVQIPACGRAFDLPSTLPILPNPLRVLPGVWIPPLLDVLGVAYLY